MTISSCGKDSFVFKASSFAFVSSARGGGEASAEKRGVCFKGWASQPFENLAPGGFH